MHAEHASQVINLVQSRALEPTFEAADVGSAGNKAEVFLRQALRVAGSLHSGREVVSKERGGFHPPELVRHEPHRTTIYRIHFCAKAKRLSSPDLSVLYRFKREVTDLGPAACLPRSLSDTWLHALIKSADALIAGEDPSAESALSLAAVFTILQGSHRGEPLTNTDELTLLSILNDFRIELALELVHRSTDVRYEAATLHTIFTDRDVSIWREV